MIQEIGVARAPGSSFFNDPESGSKLVRFALYKTVEMLEEGFEPAAENLIRGFGTLGAAPVLKTQRESHNIC